MTDSEIGPGEGGGELRVAHQKPRTGAPGKAVFTQGGQIPKSPPNEKTQRVPGKGQSYWANLQPNPHM